jgi:molybdenum cofactor cytidylyltransferase
MKLKHSLRAKDPVYAALVGAGGKTTALFLLARQLNAPVLVSTSTHLGVEQAALADQHIILKDNHFPVDFQNQLNGAVILISGPVGYDQRIHGLHPEQMEILNDHAREAGISLLVEADGSRRLPLKAPGAHEPVIPEWVDLVIVSAGLQGLGKPLSEDTIHRSEIFARLGQATIGESVNIDHIAAELAHPEGGLKNIPAAARKTVLLNQVDTPELQKHGTELASKLTNQYDSILLASLQNPAVEVISVHEPTAGIILAAGSSTRFGQPKILLDWHGAPLIRREAEAALASGLSPVIVVLGAVIEPVVAALEGLPVHIQVNEHWKSGQGHSVEAGIRALSASAGAAVFLLGDQPQVSVEVLRSLIEVHRRSLAPIIAPQVKGMRANPVLFDRVTFPDLRLLEGDKGGRSLFSRYPVTLMPWEDDRLLMDIDTPEDYRRLLETQRHE